ncbi:hypothetical protein MKW94_004772 [Papaver nudicaule]|uniref:GATA transcription factor n=1 Tax=Papaver nudicaule TaxID=74823 RepID=A0AA41VWE0_PAPNU|nr:hypothetical protein [Papaver nudicaule]
MECVEAKAFKTSLWRPEMLVKSSSPATTNPQQVVFFHGEEEEVFKTNGLFSNNGGGDEETFVDEFLDFSNEVIAKEEETEEEIYQTVEAKVNDNTEMTMKAVFSPEKSLKNDFASVFATELSVPTDDLADLEWLSHFVEDSFSEEFSQTQYNDGNPTVLAKPVVKPENHQFKPEPQFIKTESIETVSFTFSPQQPPHLPQLCQPTPAAAAATTVPGKARSKRARTGGRVWSLGGYSSLPETSSSSSTNTGTTTSSTTSSSSSYLLFHNDRAPDTYFYETLRKPPVMKQKKQRGGGFVNDDDYGGYGGGARAAIRTQCSHCGVTKTPQWRTGPLGAKTLCNACGVRFKSGRLLPEYRPASSPSFSREVHSNSHRKVLEMRKKKEVVGAPEPGFTPAVHSF